MEIEIIFEQTFQVAEYTPMKAGVTMKIEVDDDEPEGALADAFLAAKQTVWGQLGLEYEITDGIARLAGEFNGASASMAKKGKAKANAKTQAVKGKAKKAVASKSSGSRGSGGKRNDSFDWEAYEEDERDYAWSHLGENPDEWWDNREDKRNPRAPDFKLKSDGDVALWITDDDSKYEPSEAELEALEQLDE